MTVVVVVIPVRLHLLKNKNKPQQDIPWWWRGGVRLHTTEEEDEDEYFANQQSTKPSLSNCMMGGMC